MVVRRQPPDHFLYSCATIAVVPSEPRPANFGLAWLLLSVALACHVTDEALTGFLPAYNATVRALRTEYSWYPMPTFEFRGWLTLLIAAVVILLLLTPLAYRNSPVLRPLAYFFATVMFLNGTGHTLATIFGRTAASVPIPRPAPGFFSSPFLLAGSIYLWLRLRRSVRSRNAAAQPAAPRPA